MNTYFIDSHCHLEPEDFRAPDGTDERPQVMARAAAAGVRTLIVVGSGQGRSEVDNAVALSRAHAHIFAAIGVHPHHASIIVAPDAPVSTAEPGAVADLDPLRGEALWQHIEHLARTEPRVVAVGESGLDYYYKYAPPAHQQELMRRFIALSAATRKPLSLHIRDAHADAQRLVAEADAAPAGGVVHCFTGDRDDARAWLELGFHISLSGIVTFKNAAAIRTAAQFVPAGRLLLETDCPYLAPVPLRGQRNEPAHLVHTAQLVAELRGVTIAQLAAETSAATERLFLSGLLSLAQQNSAQ